MMAGGPPAPARVAEAADARISGAAAPSDGDVPEPVPSQQLMQGRKQLEISHNGQVYRLQQTRQGKLILTK